MKRILVVGLCLALLLTALLGTQALADSAKIVLVNPGGLEVSEGGKAVYAQIQAKFKEASGIDLEIELFSPSWDGYMERMQTMLASGEQVDLFPAWSAMTMQFVGAQMVMPLDDLLADHGANIQAVVPEYAWRYMDIDGKVYGLPRLRNMYDVPLMAIRSDWLEQLDIEAPTNLEELSAALETIVQSDPYGNGGTIGMDWRYREDDAYFGINYLRYLYGITAHEETDLFIDENGEIKSFMQHPNFKAYLDTMKSYIESGVINKDCFVVEAAISNERITSGVTAMYRVNYNTTVGDLIKLRLNNPDASYTYLPFENTYVYGKLCSDFLLIPESSEHADVVVQYMDWLLADKENFYLANYGIEGVHWQMEGDQIVLIETAEDQAYSGQYTGSFNMYGLAGYGSDPSVGLVKPTFASDEQAATYAVDFAAHDAWIKEHEDLFRAPDLYGFSYALDGVAQQTHSTRRSDAYRTFSEYVMGRTDWPVVEEAIRLYMEGLGGPEEQQQIATQYEAWAARWIQ